MMRRRLLIAVLAIGCGGGESASSDTSAGSTPAGNAPASRTNATADQFRSLRWIEGVWRGAGAPEPFFESYRFVDDSTLLVMHHSTESAPDTTAEDSVTFRGGTVRNAGVEASWVASAITDSSITFVPERGANGFSWTRESADAWLASISRPSGPPLQYRMTRIRK
jgi:hypothetical protein